MSRDRYFEWLVGDSKGDVVTLIDITEDDGHYYFNFSDGDCCDMAYISPMVTNKTKLKDKAMVEVASPNAKWTFEEIKEKTYKTAEDTIVKAPPLEDITSGGGMGQSVDLQGSFLGSVKIVPPANNKILYSSLPTIEDYLRKKEVKKTKFHPIVETDSIFTSESSQTQIFDGTVHPINPEQEAIVPQPDVVHWTEPLRIPEYEAQTQADPVEILAKNCKKHPTDISMTVTIDLPSKSVFNIAKDEFADGAKKFIDYLTAQIDVNEIISSIKDSLYATYLNDMQGSEK